MTAPPLSVMLLMLFSICLSIFLRAKVKPEVARTAQSTVGLRLLRCIFVAVIVGTLYSSVLSSNHNLNHVVVCEDSGTQCFKFEGVYQFSTFTRWCWMLEGLFFISANLSDCFGMLSPRFVQALFGVTSSSAIMVTTVTYGLLVPGALLLDNPPARQGSIEILLSYQGHAMHSLNLVFMLCELWFSGRTMQLADLPFGLSWGFLYICFEWTFFYYNGIWHYPFLNYNHPFALLFHIILVGVFAVYWIWGCKLSMALAPQNEHTA